MCKFIWRGLSAGTITRSVKCSVNCACVLLLAFPALITGCGCLTGKDVKLTPKKTSLVREVTGTSSGVTRGGDEPGRF